MKKIYINWIFILGIGIASLTFDLIAYFFLFPAFSTSDMLKLVTYVGLPFLPIITFSIISPLVLRIKTTSKSFYIFGMPWIFKIEKEKLEKISIITYGIAFLPKNGHYKYMKSSKSGRYEGWKIIKFPNLKGWGALIDFFKDMNPAVDINWDALNEEKENYIRKKL